MLTPLGKATRKLRIDRGAILKEMADELGVKSSYLSAVEMGKKRAPNELVEKIITYFQISSGDKEHWYALAAQSQPEVKISLSGMNDNDRETALLFARKLNSMSDDDKFKLKTLLEK